MKFSEPTPKMILNNIFHTSLVTDFSFVAVANLKNLNLKLKISKSQFLNPSASAVLKGSNHENGYQPSVP
jgi:hypothetical protein